MNRIRLGGWTLGVAVAALSLVAAMAQAPGGRAWKGNGRGGGEGLVERMARQLDLTADQRSAIRGIGAKYFGGALGDDRDALRQARRNLEALVRDPAATDEQVKDAVNAVSAQAALVALEGHHMAVEISAVLTPEHRQKAAALRGRRHAGKGSPPPEDPAEM